MPPILNLMASKAAGSIRLFRAFGIDVFVHWSWLAVAVIWYQFAARGSHLFANSVWHVALYLSLFAIVTLHEFGHALACKSVGGIANRIILWPLGGVAFVQPPTRPGATLWSIAAGPLVNVVLIPILFAALFVVEASPASSPLNQSTDLGRYITVLNDINFALLIFNMLPVYPLDGGQILQSILWFFLGRTRSLKVASVIGLVVAACAAIPLLVMGKPWLFILTLFIGWQAWSGYQYARQLGYAEAWQRGAGR